MAPITNGKVLLILSALLHRAVVWDLLLAMALHAPSNAGAVVVPDRRSALYNRMRLSVFQEDKQIGIIEIKGKRETYAPHSEYTPRVGIRQGPARIGVKNENALRVGHTSGTRRRKQENSLEVEQDFTPQQDRDTQRMRDHRDPPESDVSSSKTLEDWSRDLMELDENLEEIYPDVQLQGIDPTNNHHFLGSDLHQDSDLEWPNEVLRLEDWDQDLT